MADIRENIEEMIEESYLLGLSESEIRSDLDRFVETCGRVIHANVRDRRQMESLVDKLARARALTLIEDQQGPQDDAMGELPGEPGTVRSSLERFAGRVARNKRTILRAIAQCDPRLVSLIERERFPKRPAKRPAALPFPSPPASRLKDLVLKVCYVVTVLFILLLAYLVLLQNV